MMENSNSSLFHNNIFTHLWPINPIFVHYLYFWFTIIGLICFCFVLLGIPNDTLKNPDSPLFVHIFTGIFDWNFLTYFKLGI